MNSSLRSLARTWALALVGALGLAACATARREPWLLATDGLREHPQRDLERISSYPQALAATLDIMRRDLGLPVRPAKFVFLPDDRSLEALLLRSGHSPRLARDSARTLVAITGPRLVLVNQPRLERQGGWPARVSLLAHELAHALQYELGGATRGGSAQWLREGFARWVEIRVMEILGREAVGRARQHAIIRLRAHAEGRPEMLGRRRSRAFGWSSRRGRLPPLAKLGSFSEWLEQTRGGAGEILDDYAFLATLLLVEEHGEAAVLRYFELFAERQDPAANFLEVFAEREDQFEKRLRQVVSR